MRAEGRRDELEAVRFALEGPSPHPSSFIPRPSQRARYLYDFVDFELIADFQIVEILEREAAFESGLDLADVVLEAFERVQLPVVYHDIVAQQAHLGVASTHDALDDVTARHGAHAGNLERLPDFDQTEDVFLAVRRKHASAT